MGTFDLTTKAGKPDFIGSYRHSYSDTDPHSYTTNIIVDTHFANSLLFETVVATQNASSPDTVSITGYLNLQESDSPTTGFTQIPQDRIITGFNKAQFDLHEDYNAGTFISQIARIGTYGNKRYVEIGIVANASRSAGVATFFIGTLFRKEVSTSPFSTLI